jgi:putative oxygen-independent coproporphyrinogen III oxidase
LLPNEDIPLSPADRGVASHAPDSPPPERGRSARLTASGGGFGPADDPSPGPRPDPPPSGEGLSSNESPRGLRVKSDNGDSDFAVYIHWPFCLAKCPYCDFNSHVRSGGYDEAQFVRAARRELATTAARVPGRTVSTIFFGGGTPSLMQPASVDALLDAVAQHWTIAPDAEITLEANPTSVEAARFRGFRDAGVNRVSLGVQALDDAALQKLGRRHSVEEALAAVALARETFPRFSFDLIYARSGQTVEAWRAELLRALSYADDHLSLYQLTIEPDTPFAALHRAGRLLVPDAALARDLYDVTQDVCAAAGLPAYEVSNHARPGGECRHNLVYWRYGDYAGIGPGAHGRLNIAGKRQATAAEKNPEVWLARVEQDGHGLVEDTPLLRSEQADEFLLMGLRLAEGIDPGRYARIAGRPLDLGRIADLMGYGFVETTGDGRLRVTRAGFPVLDAVVADLAA